MASGKDYSNLYGQAYVAYGQGNYEEAASYIEEMGEATPMIPMFYSFKVIFISA